MSYFRLSTYRLFLCNILKVATQELLKIKEKEEEKIQEIFGKNFEMFNNKRRITVRYKSANPLFEQWLNEWKEEAIEKGSKIQYTYRTALASLKKCPIVFNSGQECKILKGFGDHLCKLLDQRLRLHKSELTDDQNVDLNGLGTLNGDKKRKETESRENIVNNGSKKPKKYRKDLVNEHKSEEFDVPECMTLEDNKTTFAESSTDKRKKETAKKKGTNKSENNKILLSKASSSGSNEPEVSNSQSSQATSQEEEFYILEPGKFDVILYVDTAEASSEPSDPLLKELNKLSGVCRYEVKKLHVGDYVWVCRDKSTNNELVLPYIFERKRLDDLASSIKDGRYKEQKYRLKRSGIENIYYLIEQCKRHISFPLASLHQAAINTAVQDGFRIKKTLDLTHTARLLNKFSGLLTHLFGNKTLVKCSKENLGLVNLSDDLVSLMSFKEFNRASVKNKPLKVTDLFIKMLIQIKGMSVQKAMAITQKYPTPLLLKKALDETGFEAFQKQLSELSYEKQKVGAPLSRTVTQLFDSKQF